MSAQQLNDARQRRAATQLSARLEKALAAYATAAAAAGVSLLALAPSAGAKIVYTPAHTDIPMNGSAPLDLNHDGIADFSFVNKEWTGDEGEFAFLLGAVAKNPSNAIRAKGLSGGSFPFYFQGLFATALRAGFTVGPSKSYFKKNANGLLASDQGAGYTSTSAGQWLYTQRRYLGLRFIINGQAHYGWARLNVTLQYYVGIQATLTGYAYETIPNKPIIAGKTHGPDVIVNDATLGELAVGRK